MADAATPSPLQFGRFRRLPRRDSHVWQGGIVRMPMWVDAAGGGPPTRPWAAVWVTKPDQLIAVEIAEQPGKPGTELAVKAFVEHALRYHDVLLGRPSRVEVTDAGFGAAVVAALGDPDVAVDVVPSLPDVHAMLRSFAERQQADLAVPTLLSGAGVTLDDVRRFAEAAARFWRAEPWQYLTNDDRLTVEMPRLDRRLRYATVMGNAGLQYGLAFHTTPDDLAGASPVFDGRRTYWSVTFCPAHDIPVGDLALWEEHQLPVADDRAYPLIMGHGAGDSLTVPPAAMLRQATWLLAALADSSEADIDSGRWTKRARVGDSHAAVTLALPHVADAAPEDRTPHAPRHDRRSGERVHAEIRRFMESQDFKTLDEANAALQARFAGQRLDDAPSTASTPLERAQEIMYDAFEAIGRRRIILARRALEICPDCADAYVLMAEAAAGPARALPLYEQALAAGERALGAARFSDDAGHFWSLLDTRPYMRARAGLAQTLSELGRRDEASAHYRELLRLNPNDNQGIRYLLLGESLRAGRDDEVENLFTRYGDDVAAEWCYSWALFEFRRGRLAEADSRLQVALEWNPSVPAALAIPAGELPPYGDAVAIGGFGEAVIYAAHFGDLWRDTPGAFAWLSAGALKGAAPPRPRRRRRPRPGKPPAG
jgi:tetratricopeptide (TPR) repeat protein